MSIVCTEFIITERDRSFIHKNINYKSVFNNAMKVLFNQFTCNVVTICWVRLPSLS
jgi:ABC-type microcin C transport system permease subunit YejB